MSNLARTPGDPKPKGLPYWLFFLACLVFAVLGLAALGFTVYYLRSDKIENERQREALAAQRERGEIERQRGAEADRVTQAHNLQERLLAEVSTATNSLLQLLADGDALRAEATALRTNEAGRKVAIHPTLVPLARRFYDTSLPGLPPESEVVAQLEAVRRVGQQVAENRGKAYEPAPTMTGTVQQALRWGAEASGRMKEVRALLSALIQDSQIKFTRATLTAESPTLAAAIEELNRNEASASVVQAEKTTVAAQTTAVQTRAEADAEKIRAEADRYAEEVRRKIAEEQAAKEREWKDREARIKLEESKTKVAVQDKVDEARKVELKKKASTPEVQGKLAPFITPGHAQIGGVSPDALPHSLSKLQGCGALDPTMRGMGALLEVAISKNDTQRPRWSIDRKFWVNHPADIAKIKEALALLNELGPVLVEMGKLQP